MCGVGYNSETKTQQSLFLGLKTIASPHTAERIDALMIDILQVFVCV